MELKGPAYTVPLGWRDVTVADLASASDNALATGPFGSSIGSRFFQEFGVPVIRGSNLSADGRTHLIEDEYVFISEAKAAEFRRSTVTRGDLIFTCWGTINQIGLVGPRAAYPQYVISNKQMKLTPDPSKADSLFLFYLFSGPDLQRTLIEQSIGSSVPGFNLGQLRSMRVRVPDLPEQRAIAATLGDVDGLLGALGRLAAKKRDLKQAAMRQLLTGKTRLPGFGGAWHVKRLEDVAHVDPENLGSETRPDYSFKYISLEDVEAGTLKRYSELVFWGAPSRARRKLRNGDVLVSTVRPNLRSHLLFASDDEDWVCSTGFDVVRCKGGLAHPVYVFFSVFGDCISRQIDALLTGSNYPAINSGDVRALELALPEYDEQAAIASVLSDMDAEIAALEARLAKTRALKQGMMQELLTGRIRLPVPA